MNIWSSPEFSAISKDFTYAGYLNLRQDMLDAGCQVGAQVSKMGYYLLWNFFGAEMEEDGFPPGA